jgi:hypothetical protein
LYCSVDHRKPWETLHIRFKRRPKIIYIGMREGERDIPYLGKKKKIYPTQEDGNDL